MTMEFEGIFRGPWKKTCYWHDHYNRCYCYKCCGTFDSVVKLWSFSRYKFIGKRSALKNDWKVLCKTQHLRYNCACSLFYCNSYRSSSRIKKLSYDWGWIRGVRFTILTLGFRRIFRNYLSRISPFIPCGFFCIKRWNTNVIKMRMGVARWMVESKKKRLHLWLMMRHTDII